MTYILVQNPDGTWFFEAWTVPDVATAYQSHSYSNRTSAEREARAYIRRCQRRAP